MSPEVSNKVEAEYSNGDPVDEEEGQNEEVAEEDEVNSHDAPCSAERLPAHMFNPDIHAGWRYGITAFLVFTFILLLVADVSSGVTAKTLIVAPDGEVFDETEILTVSIFTSVGELWHAGSYALAIFVCIASVSWPYVKLLLSLWAWVFPIRDIKRRECFIEIVDAFDKWSFVDVFVLTIIMVAFRSSIDVGAGVVLQVLIVPKWGFFAFVAANILSLIGTQAILYHHRQIQYHNHQEEEVKDDPENDEGPHEEKMCIAAQTKTSAPLLVFLFVVGTALHFVACSLHIYQVENSRAEENFVVPYSVFSIGMAVPGTSLEPNSFGVRWLQFMFFLFTVALPAWSTILFGVLYFCRMGSWLREKVFFLAEITFSWVAIEVFTVSAIFSILQIPKFGNGLIDAGCKECYQVDSAILPQFGVLVVATLLNVVVIVWLFFRAHKVVFTH